jgi:glycerophosphoryl diester phosphodiesterase
MKLPAALDYAGRRVLLKVHKFGSGLGHHPPNCLAALDEALEGGAEVVEFDVRLLGDNHYVLLHDATLERETDGLGLVSALDSRALGAVRVRGGSASPALLNEVVRRLAAHQAPLKVQVDLKEVMPLTPEAARSLLETLEPMRANGFLRVVVGCLADWNLRLLRRLDRTLDVGNDPAFYIHAPFPGFEMPLPTRINAYGYCDDHPLGFRKVMPVADYLRDRIDVVASQVPGACEFYLHKAFVKRCLEDGFDVVRYLAMEHGALVDVWTLNPGDAEFESHLKTALEAGAGQVTTDSPVGVAAAVAAWAT